MAFLFGITSASLLATINTAAESATSAEPLIQSFFLYITIFSLFLYTGKYTLSKITIATEEAIHKVKIRIIHKIRLSELQFIEKINYSIIYTKLTHDTNLISQTAYLLIIAVQSTIIVIFSLFYIAWLSPISFLLAITFLSLGIFLYLGIEKQIEENLLLTHQKETEFHDALNPILGGFKELKINQRKSDDVFHHIENISTETHKLKIIGSSQIITTIIYSYIISYILLALIVFIMPELSKIYPTVILKLTAVILFIISPLNTIAGIFPILIRINSAITNIYNLEAEIDAEMRSTYKSQVQRTPINFEQIVLKEVTFHYANEKESATFSIYPINLKIKRGEIIFITGENGSGKSTLIKLLTGLYYPTMGHLYLDDEPLDKTNYQDYRELFAVVFSDSYLFDRFYGVDLFDEKRLSALLQAMNLNRKTCRLENPFALSTGQKKRLSLVVALLENKPIYVFDVVTADQDAYFRKYFYEILLKELKTQGKTVIVVTHDNQYFEGATRILNMDHGKISSL